MPKYIAGQYRQGHAYVEFDLSGVNPTPIRCHGLVDTGFTGFVHLPMQYAFSLGLPLQGTVGSRLADGSQITEYTATGLVTLQGVQKAGTVVLATGSREILIGMGFLQQFALGLYLTRDAVFLFESPPETG